MDSPQESPRERPWLFAVSAVPPLLWLAGLFFAPLLIIWGYSFGEKSGLIDIEVTWTLDNYIRALDPIYFQIFTRSLAYALATTALCLAIGFPVAMVIAFSDPRWRPFLLFLIVLPFWTNLLIRTYALVRILGNKGTVNTGITWLWERVSVAMEILGLPALEPFTPLPMLFNSFAVVFGLTYVALPFMILPLYASLERLNRQHMEASLDLGAGQWRTFFLVVVPLTSTGIFSGLVITFIPTLGSFLTPDILGGPDSSMIATVIARQFGSANHWPFGSAMAYILVYATFFLLALNAMFVIRRQRARDTAGQEAVAAPPAAAKETAS
ncbi:MAG: ABC transporter permease [Alphaproteobacteria bacterium]|nr:ABC transporter permease [Alphaproteobacteria bacterium]MDA7987085.1 ABC transporter permease [Alphaproteobacteria bacterium]